MRNKERRYIPESVLQKTSRDIEKIEEEVSKVVMGQKDIVQHIIQAILCNGHILIEGVPGVAKTLIVRALAAVTGCDMKRIQFTVDLLPSDIIGINSYNPSTKVFSFKEGPVFTNFLIADEINRSPPKTQSALLQAMQEKEVSVGNDTHDIKKPFLVMATQNPIEQSGVYNLPEAEVDRFLFKINIDYPQFAEEISILDTNITMHNFDDYNLKEVISRVDILNLQQRVKEVFSSKEIKDYLVKIVHLTRDKNKSYSKYISLGASPRGAIALHIASKAKALMSGRDYVLPEDVNAVAKPVLRHRLILNYKAEAEKVTPDKVIEEILNHLNPA
ncbi:MAG: MoxR family ATPase [Nanoarchaeota archaeon]